MVKRQNSKIVQWLMLIFCAAFLLTAPAGALAAAPGTSVKPSAGALPDKQAANGPLAINNQLVFQAPGVKLLDAAQAQALEQRLAALNAKHDVHVGIVFLKELPAGKTAEQVAKGIVEGGGGYEQGQNGSMVFLVALGSRDYYIATGRYLNKRITSKEGVAHIQEEILPQLKDNKFADAAKTFVDTVEMELDYYAAEGEPYDPANEFSAMAAVIALVGGGLTFFAVRGHLIGQLSNVFDAAAADEYLDEGSFALSYKDDTYLYTDVTSTPKSKSSSSSSSSGDSGSTGGGGGKF